jgi:predicted restriction endonuclease
MQLTWQQAVKAALERYATKNSTVQIERERFLQQELSRIIADTASVGKTPSQTVSRVLQELRDDGFLFFSNSGKYTLNQVTINASNEDLPDDVLDNAISTGQLKLSDVETSSDVAISRIRRGVHALRKRTLFNYRDSCALCDVNDPSLLVASHISRWADRPEARGLLSNTICFCTLHDKLFEVGYFSMNHELKLIWKTPQPIKVIDTWRQQCTVKFKLPQSITPALHFLDEHRRRVNL